MDLNLLVALDALLEENSVAAAAERLNLSAPAMSRTLARIRRATGDDILVRSGRSMVPTARALELRDEARELVRRASAVLTPPQELDLATLDRHFTVRGHDALLGALAPPLTSSLRTKAPLVKVSLLAETDTDRPDLARGHVDLELGSTVPDRTGISYEVLGRDRMVLALRRGHPMAGRRLTLERLAELDHVTISRRGRLHGVLDEALAARGLKRRVLAALPTSAAALDVVAGSDVVVVVAERVCGPLASRLGVVTRTAPVDLPPVEVVMTWHHRHDSDPAHAWLRGEARAAL
ncbi:LysR family transcriptional regulator [Actinoplanes sp. NPDC051411]|uniref:LysR family transcriptional regulator n=1 Tax=Actinoplanes sp. NPDC051411 TaxID=3155522 RepID=UPI0034287094